MKKGPFQMKYHASPLRSQLNSPLKQDNPLTWFNKNLNPFYPSEEEIKMHNKNRNKTYYVKDKNGAWIPTTINEQLANTVKMNTVVRDRITEEEASWKTIPCTDGNCKHWDADPDTPGHQMVPGEEYDNTLRDHEIMKEQKKQEEKMRELYPNYVDLQITLPETEIVAEDKRKYYYPKGSNIKIVDDRSKLAQILNPRRKIKGEGGSINEVDLETQYGKL